MTKKQKVQLAIIWICIITMIAMILIYIASVVIDIYQKHERGKQTVLEFNELYETEEKQVILFATPYCPFCQETKPLLETIAQENKFEIYYFDTSVVPKDEMNNIIDKLELNIKGVPHLVVIENKKLVGELSGKRDKETTIKFLTDTGIIEKVKE